MKPTKFFIIFSAAAVIIALNFSPCNGSAINIDAQIPPIQLQTPDGAPFNINSMDEKPIIITFFTSWSKTCFVNLKFLKSLQSKHKNKFEVIAISLDQKQLSLNTFLKNNDLPFVFLFDKKLKTINDFQILIIPTTMLINKDKILKNIYVDFDEVIEKSISIDIADLLAPKK